MTSVEGRIWSKMKGLKRLWLFRKLNLNLRAELIVNIALLILAAVVLIGFTVFKIYERNLIAEKIRYGEEMIQDFQTVVDFMLRERQEYSLKNSEIRRDLGDFVSLYSKDKGFQDLLVTDTEMKVLVSKRGELGGKESETLLRRAIELGQVQPMIEKSGGFWSIQYGKISLYSPLWGRGKIVGGIEMGLPTGDVMVRLLEFRRTILMAILGDGIVLIAFGTFLLSRVLVKPIKELARLTRNIMEGDFTQKIESNSRNEIGQLVTSFNRMTDRLKENQESLETHVASLESANRQLKQAQEELIRTEKLVSIGRFAAGVAHEVGNPLGAILGYTSILEQDGLDREEARDYLRRIEKEIERINRIVRELLDFARPSRVEIREVGMNKVIESTLSLLSYQKDFRNVTTQLELQSSLPSIKGDETQLSQVFLNIVLNAIDAMPEGGTLTIRTEEYIVEGFRITPSEPLFAPRRKGDPEEKDYSRMRKPSPLSVLLTKFSKGDRLVRARISDTGIGIKKQDLERIFDPFFTTKDPNKGTGLGLSVSLRIVESMGGEIRVESEVGKGSAFEVYFPESAP
jgi:two-component system, NtrC family, sensor kinase